jgi:hypothetical protein
MQEYVIIDKTTIQKRIEELEKQMQEHIQSAQKTGDYDSQFEDKLEELKQILSQSTPLIPEIEKAHNVGRNYGCYLQGGSYDPSNNIDSEDYISNLKLDI